MTQLFSRLFAAVSLCVAVSSAVGCVGADGDVGRASAPVVYDDDDRTDVYAHPDARLRAIAQNSVAAFMQASVVDTSDPSDVTFSSPTLGERLQLCPGERFQSDPTAAFCSGTLIGEDLVLTAGHCFDDASRCGATRVVFNYYRDGEGSLARVTTRDVFSCREVVAHFNGEANGQTLDFAVVRLDRAAAPRFTPARVRATAAPLPVGQALAVIGFGSGVPAKIDDGGVVTDPRGDVVDFFRASTDTFQGNSGSGVFDPRTGELLGVLVRGATDYVELPGDGCRVVNRCPASGCVGDRVDDGEQITYAHHALAALDGNGVGRGWGGTAGCSVDSTPGAHRDASLLALGGLAGIALAWRARRRGALATAR